MSGGILSSLLRCISCWIQRISHSSLLHKNSWMMAKGSIINSQKTLAVMILEVKMLSLRIFFRMQSGQHVWVTICHFM